MRLLLLTRLSYILKLPGTTDRYCLAHFLRKSLLWETSSSAPLYLLQAAISASTDSRSRKLVGSSMMSRCGQTKVSLLKMTQERCEKDRRCMRVSAVLPTTEVLARCWRSVPADSSGNWLPMNSMGVCSRFSSAVECWPK